MKRLLFVLLAACGSSDDSGPPATPPESVALFDNLAAPTPNKLRGVWSREAVGSAGSADTRFRFTDGKVIAGTRCTSSANLTAPFVVGQIGDITSTELDQPQGQLVVPSAIGYQSTVSGVTCTGVFSAATWTFVVTDLQMVISAQGIKNEITFKKVGD